MAERLELPRSSVFSVATFYKVFSLSPQGRTIVQVCKGTACHVRGAQLLEDELCRQLGVEVGQIAVVLVAAPLLVVLPRGCASDEDGATTFLAPEWLRKVGCVVLLGLGLTWFAVRLF